MRSVLKPALALAAAVSLLTACGGSPASTPAPTFPPTMPAGSGGMPTSVPTQMTTPMSTMPVAATIPNGQGSAPTTVVNDNGMTATPETSTGGNGGNSGNGSAASINPNGKAPTGWKTVLDTSKRCQAAVPKDWVTGVQEGMAQEPTFRGQLMVSADEFSNFGGTWKSYRKSIHDTWLGEATGAKTGRKVFTENDNLMVIGSTESTGDLTYLVFLNEKTYACGAMVTISQVLRPQLSGTAVQIANSLGPAK